jgi:predicted  nucleic acid-binding Zn-ribbon protein
MIKKCFNCGHEYEEKDEKEIMPTCKYCKYYKVRKYIYNSSTEILKDSENLQAVTGYYVKFEDYKELCNKYDELQKAYFKRSKYRPY